jgi:probable blue pigment (indigoidine) exporter
MMVARGAGQGRSTSFVRDLVLTASAPAAWGTTYVVTTELLPPGRPLLAAVLRVLPIGLALSLASRRRPSGVWWWRMAVLGVLNIGAFQALLFVAAYRLPGGVAATAGAIQPLVVAGLAAVALGEPFHRRTGLAGVAGGAGVAALVLGPAAALDPVGIVAALGGTLCMATGVVLTKRWGRPVGLLLATGWQLTAGGLLLLPLALAIEGPPPALTVPGWLGIAWLALVGTGVAYALWFRGLERLPVTAVSFLGLLSPTVATLLGWLLLGQRLTLVQLGGAVLVGAAIVAAQRPPTARLTEDPVRARRWSRGRRQATESAIADPRSRAGRATIARSKRSSSSASSRSLTGAQSGPSSEKCLPASEPAMRAT